MNVSNVEGRDIPTTAIDALPPDLPVCVAMTDLDGFAVFNDEAGRPSGDELLNLFERTLRTNLPPAALINRIGGDEWVIALPELSLENAVVLMNEVRAHIETAALGSTEHQVTVSVGLAARPPHGTNGDELLRAADEALSRSKRSGRNRVGIYVEDKMVMKSNYYGRATLDRLAALSRATNRTEASLLREAADTLLATYAEEM